MRVIRTDVGVLGAPVKTPTGMRFQSIVASTEPMTYLQSDGTTRRESRGVDEMKSIVKQLPGKPITNQHPNDGLYSSGSRHPVAGRVVDAHLEQDGDVTHAVATLEVNDPVTLQAIRDGLRDLSMGYAANVGMLPDDDGTYEQTDCAVDHVAVVQTGRCPSCELRADRRDCADACTCKTPPKSKCTTCNLDGCDFVEPKMTDDSIDDWDLSVYPDYHPAAPAKRYSADYDAGAAAAEARDAAPANRADDDDPFEYEKQMERELRAATVASLKREPNPIAGSRVPRGDVVNVRAVSEVADYLDYEKQIAIAARDATYNRGMPAKKVH